MSRADVFALTVAVLLFIVGLALYLRVRVGSRKKKVNDRISLVTAMKDGIGITGDDELFRAHDGRFGAGTIARLRHGLMEALQPVGGVKVVRTLILMSAAAAAVTMYVGQKILAMPLLFNIGMAAAAALFMPYSFVKGETKKRRTKFLDIFPDAIDLIVRAIRAGIPISESIAAAGRELEEPLAGEFRRIAEEIAIGVSPERVLTEATERIRIPDFNFFCVTLVLQRETGGNLAETLENLSGLLRKRREMRLKVVALTAEGRFTSKILGGLPFLVMGALFVLNRSYVDLLFSDPQGQMFLGIAVGLILTGLVMLNQMIKLDI